MSFKTLLVPVEQNDTMPQTLATALRFARRFDAHLLGFALQPAVFEFYAFEIVGSMPVANVKENAKFAEEARVQFESFMSENQVPRRTGPGAGLSFGWRAEAAEEVDVVGSLGRVFDLTVLGRPGSSINSPRMSTLESCLFDSGRPVLIAPPDGCERIGEHVLIAWNCSTEQARTTAFAMPLLHKAAKVTILTVEGATVPGPTGEQLAGNLRIHGIDATPVTIQPREQSAGEAILAYAAANGCDLVVKGAYTQSRLRQMIFGGATRHLLTASTLPIFMAH